MKNNTGIKKNKPVGFQDGRTHLNLLKKFKNLSKNLTEPSKLLVADMQLNNGDNELHVVEVQKDTFKLFGKRYIVNGDYMVYNRTLKMHTCKYHEGLSLPIKQHIEITKVKEAIMNKATEQQLDVINNIDPVILEALVQSKIIEKVFNGAEMQDLFGLIKVLSVIILLISGISLVLQIGMSGIF